MLAQYPKVRLALYCVGLASTITSVFVAIVNKDLAAAFTATAAILDGAAFGVAVTNMDFKNRLTNDGWRE